MRKLGRTTEQRLAVLRNQASNLLWYGKITTTKENAKELQSYVEKIITLAVNTYTDTVKVIKTETDSKGVKIKKEVLNDGPTKLAARRKIMSKLFDRQEQRQPKETKANFIARTEGVYHPLIEKIFNVYAPKYAKRKEEVGQGGGYTRLLKLDQRRGDAAPMVMITLV